MISVDLDEIRRRQSEQFERADLDVLVVGGGIVGAGVARDAAMRGLSTALVEQHDFAFGTSSRTSRLLHGGLRYLAQGRVGLVYEASREKGILHRIAPHLAEPLPFVFPGYRRSGWPLWQLRVGVKIYDLLCGGRNLGPSSSMSPSDVLRRLPEPKPKGMNGAVRYYDGLTNDARLVLDTLRSAVKAGAAICNFTRLESAVPDAGRWTCQVRDREADRERTVRARAVVNATGPWTQSLPESSIRLRLTKGIHLVIEHEVLPILDAVVMTQANRILFAIPWGERVILGTTDTDYDGPLDQVPVTRDDVDCVLDVVNEAFPSARIDRTHIVSSWAGLRPLVASVKGGPSDISRAHEIRQPKAGWFDVAGGKLTTYRLIAEQVVDRVASHLGKKTMPCTTATEPILAADEVQGLSGILPPEVRPEVVEHYCRSEWAAHLDDVMIRRTNWRHYHRNAGEIARQVADWMAEIFHWDAARRAEELIRYQQSAG